MSAADAPRAFLIVDDHPILRLGVRQLVERGWPDATIVEADTIAQACAAARARRFDAVILDLVMPDVSGTEGVTRMLEAVGDTPILVLSFDREAKNAARVLQMGVAGYLPKDRAGDELVNALQRVLQGKRHVTEELAEYLVAALGGDAATGQPHERLSAQEYRVMLLLAEGMTPARIAEALGVSVRTVGTYRARILVKTGWQSNVELAKYCLQHGLVDAAR